MRLMLIGTDRHLLAPQTGVTERFARMGARFPNDTFESIVFSTRTHDIAKTHTIAPNVRAHATDSRSRLFYGLDARRLAARLPRPDIVTAQDPFETGLAALLIARYFRAPLMVEVHTDFLSPDFARHSLLNRLRVLLAGFVLRRAAGGYAVSRRVRDEMHARYHLAAPFEVFPIYVDTEKFSVLPRMPERGNLLWVGRFAEEKNPILALQAFAHARETGHAIRLTMLGEGPLESRLRTLVQERGIGSEVTFAGWQSPESFLSHAELLLVTSSYEGYGLALVEALAAGVPVLATDVGVARDAGAVIASGDYADALNEWLNGPRERGVLRLPSYANEGEYFTHVRDFYASRV